MAWWPHGNTNTALSATPAHAPARDIQKCSIDCLDHDAFQFPGASRVANLYIQQNAFTELPEPLLWNM